MAALALATAGAAHAHAIPLHTEPASNGALSSVPNDVNFDSTACDTACWRAWRVKSVSRGSSWLTRIRE